MVVVNRAQLKALAVLISKVEIEQLEVESGPDSVEEGITLIMTDLEDHSTKLIVDKWGQGRLVP